MKKIILIMFIASLMFSLKLTAQFTSLPVRLVTAAGDPLRGQAQNIEFTAYPHNYPADKIENITIDEIGTAGNYIAKGFNEFRYVKLWLQGVNQLWFDSVLTGNIFNYLQTNYVTLGTSQTITGNKSTTGSWTGLSSGNWIYTGSAVTHTFNDPYISSGSGKYPYSPSNQNLIWRSYADSFYFPRQWGYYSQDDNRLYFNTTGLLGAFRLAKRGNGQLFDFNNEHFNWQTATGLNLNTDLLSQDSIASKIYTNVKDTTWIILGEPVSRYRFLTLKKPFWGNPPGSYPDWKWYYKSVNEGGTIQARDSFIVINHGDMSSGYMYDSKIFGGDNWSNVDTITLPERGTYRLNYSADLIFPYSEIREGPDEIYRDTVQFRIIREFDGFDNTPYSLLTIWKDFNFSILYYPECRPVSRMFIMFNQYAGSKWILQVRADLNTARVNAAVTKPLMSYILLR